MRKPKLIVVLAAAVLGILVLFALLPGTSKTLAQSSLQGTTSATGAATEEDFGAQCEALRTVPLVAATAAPGGTPAAEVEIARPSNSGGPGDALKLIGNPDAGKKIFVDNCQKCHGEEGVGGIANPGSDDGTIPELNPIDETIVDPDPLVFACNIDLFIEHGSAPSCPSPKETMQRWCDNNQLSPQQIADVISYLIVLNGQTPATAVPTVAK